MDKSTTFTAKQAIRRARMHLEEAAACLDEAEPANLAILDYLSICLDECVELEYAAPHRSAQILPFPAPR